MTLELFPLPRSHAGIPFGIRFKLDHAGDGVQACQLGTKRFIGISLLLGMGTKSAIRQVAKPLHLSVETKQLLCEKTMHPFPPNRI